MRGVYGVAQIRAAEQRRHRELLDGTLMQRAATAVANQCGVLLRGKVGRVYGSRVVLLVGTGSNGGDALHAGAMLRHRGAAVIALPIDASRCHREGLAAFVAAGGRVEADHSLALTLVAAADLVVDGIVGIGARPGLPDYALDLAFAATSRQTLAVDVPSGVDANNGVAERGAVRADVTVTFGGLKTGLLIGDGAVLSGEVRLVDIGLDFTAESAVPGLNVLENQDVSALLPTPAPSDDKYSRGVIAVAAGSDTYPGAALLAVGAARRGGAGMVRALVTSDQAGVRIAAAYPDVVVHVGDGIEGVRAQAWVVGPGLGLHEHAAALVKSVLSCDVPVLVDADGLTLLSRLLGDDPQLLRRRGAPTLLTPHDREFERLAGPVGVDRLVSVRAAASALGATVLLKGFSTVVAASDGAAFVNPTGSAWLASAGTGDVLSGLIGSLLATGTEITSAAAAGAYLHGVSGQLAALGGAPTASDIVDHLPAAIRALRIADGSGREAAASSPFDKEHWKRATF